MSRFHDEFFKQNGTGHDELLLKCLSEEGLDKIKSALSIEQEAVVPSNIDVWRCYLEGNKFEYRKNAPRLDPCWGYSLPPDPKSNRIFGEYAYRKRCTHEDFCEDTKVCRFFKDGTSGETVKCALVPYVESRIVNYKSEIIIDGGRGFVLGYADLLVDFIFHRKANVYLPNGETWAAEASPYRTRVLIEVKPELRDVGAVLRQIKTYGRFIGGRLAIATYTLPSESILKFLAHEGVTVIVFEKGHV